MSSHLSNPERWDHALFLAGFAAEFVGDLEPDFHRVALSYIDAVHKHFLLDTVLLLRCNVSTRLWAKLQCIRLAWVSANPLGD